MSVRISGQIQTISVRSNFCTFLDKFILPLRTVFTRILFYLVCKFSGSILVVFGQILIEAHLHQSWQFVPVFEIRFRVEFWLSSSGRTVHSIEDLKSYQSTKCDRISISFDRGTRLSKCALKRRSCVVSLWFSTKFSSRSLHPIKMKSKDFRQSIKRATHWHKVTWDFL